MSDVDKLLHDLKTKREHGAGNMITHMVMDEAHAEIIRLRAALDAQAGVMVKPLVWEVMHITIGSWYSSIVVHGRWLYVISDYGDGDVSLTIEGSDAGKYPSVELAKAAAQADHDARVLRCIEPTTSPLAEVAMRERAAAWHMSRIENANKQISENNEYLAKEGLTHSEANDRCREIVWNSRVAVKAIRAIPTTFTHAKLLDAAMQLPEVRALLTEASYAADVMANLGIARPTLDAALAPFTRKGE